MPFHAVGCRYVERAVDAFTDGELSEERTLATRAHLERCPACRRRARERQALHDGTRHAVHDGSGVSRAFASRVRAALDHERHEEADGRVRQRRPQAQRQRAARLPWGLLLLVTSFGVSLAVVVLSDPSATRQHAAAAANVSSASMAPGVDAFIDALIEQHATSAPTPTSAEPLSQLEREVGLPVQAPPELERQGGAFLGARSVHFGKERVASLAYRVGGHRCTLFLYDDARIPLRRSQYLSPRAVGQRPVFAGARRGYALAAVERRGLGYAIATDLDVDAAARLAAAIR